MSNLFTSILDNDFLITFQLPNLSLNPLQSRTEQAKIVQLMLSQCGEDRHPVVTPQSPPLIMQVTFHAPITRNLGRDNRTCFLLRVRRVYLQPTGHHRQKQERLGCGPRRRLLLLSVLSLALAPPSIYRSALNPPLPARAELDFVLVRP